MAERAAERRHVHDGARPRHRREPRAAARRRSTGEAYVGTKEGLEPLPSAASRTPTARSSSRRRGLQARQGRRALHARPQTRAAHRARSSGQRRSGPRGSTGGRARADAALRRREATRSCGSATATCSATTARGSFAPPNGEELEPGWKTCVGFANFKRDRQRPAHPRAVPARLRLDDRRSRRSPSSSRSRSASSSRSRSTRRGCASSALPLALRHPVRDPGLPDAARLGGAAERRLRRRQQDPGHVHPVALRPEVGQGLGASSSASG